MDFRFPYFLILLFGICSGIIYHIKLSKSSKTILILLIFTLLFEGLSYYFTNRGLSNYFLYNLFIPIQFLIITISFIYETNQKLFILFFVLLLIFFVFHLLEKSIITTFFTQILLFNLLFISYYCLYFLYKLLKIDQEVKFQSFPFFWISVGFLMFSVLNLVEYGVYNILHLNNLSKSTIIIFNNIRIYSNYLLYLIITYSFFVKPLSLADYAKSGK